MSEERRIKIVQIGKRDVLGLFQMVGSDASFCRFPVISGLPEGYRVHDVSYSFLTDTFLLKVEHESFDPVPCGEQLPWWNPHDVAMIEVRKIATEPIPDEPEIAEEPIHFANNPFVALCGSDRANQRTTCFREHATCTECRRKLEES